ncbi:MAG: enoyl-CoA hydratase-related protein, partial [Paracoccaceae bacterium]
MEFFYETLLVEHHGSHVLSVTLNRPEAANAFNTQMARDLINLFEALALSNYNLRAIVLTGSGQRAFCAGGDLKERNGMTDTVWQAQHLVYERMVRAVIGCPIPIIGA